MHPFACVDARSLVRVFVAIALLALPSSAASQTDATGSPEEDGPTVEAQLDAAQASRDQLGEDDPRRALYDELTTILVQRGTAEQRKAELAAQRDALGMRSHMSPQERWGNPEQIDVALYDQVEGALESATGDAEQARTAREVAREATRAAVAAQSALPATEGDPVRALAREVADQRVRLRREIAQNAEKAIELEDERCAQSRADFAWAAPQVVVSAADRASVAAQMDERERSERKKLQRAEVQLRDAERRWNAGSNATGDQRAALRADLKFRQKAVALQTSRFTRMAAQREAAQRRLAVLAYEVPDHATLIAWLEAARTTASSLGRERRLDEVDLSEILDERATLIQRPEGERPGKAWLRAIDGQIELHREHQEELRLAEEVHARLAATLERKAGAATWSDRAGEAWEAGKRAWRHEVGVAGDSSVTVGMIILALAMIVFGFVTSRLLARTLERRILPGFGFDTGASHAFAELAFYGLLVIVFLMSLQIVSIPLTAFAFVGGALAIGVGFGSQNVVNNFISGIILLAERPIKIGDLVQVDQTYGNIERIGLRSTRVRTGENIHVIVPNATFLETNVVNWTHSNSEVRVMIAVGVAYGSPIREVETQLMAALQGHPKILSRPEPIILFKEFGDNALHFEAHFWLRIHSQMERYKISSDIRFAIDDRFRESNIVIAYPQRDLHIDSLAPLEIRMVESAQREES